MERSTIPVRQLSVPYLGSSFPIEIGGNQKDGSSNSI
jgi:hypothetical protein